MKFLNNLDLNGNQLLSPVIHVSSQSTITNGPAGDTSGTEGQIFYNSHANGKALFFRDNSGWRPIGDISGVTAGAGLSGGGTGGTVSLAIDLSEFSDVTPANGDKILTLDSDGSTEQLTTIASLATLFAGSGLTATNSVIAVDTLNQDTTGTADHVTIVDNENTNEENQITFIEGAGGAGSRGLEADGDFTYNPSTGTVSATIFKGNIDAVDGDFDGTLEADAITIGGTNLLSEGMEFTGNTVFSGNPSFSGTPSVSGTLSVAGNIVHTGDTNCLIGFTTDAIKFQTGGTSRANVSDSGFQIGSGARVTTIEDNDSLGTSDTKLATQGNVKAYVDARTGTNITSLGTIAQDTVTFSSANANDPNVVIKNTTNDANGARLSFVKDKGAAGADNDEIGEIRFVGDDAAQTQTDFGTIRVLIAEADDTDEAGVMRLSVASSDGTTTGLTDGLTLTGHKSGDYVDVTLGAGSSSTVTVEGGLQVDGDLTVSGTNTILDSTTIATGDSFIKLAKDQGTSSDAVDFGFYGKYGESGTAKFAGLFRDAGATDEPFTFFEGTQLEPGTTLNPSGTGYALAAVKASKVIAASLDISGDVDVDGTLEADAITVNGTTLAEFISDTTGAMFSSNTESNITATYQDADNTIDLSVADAADDTKGVVELATSDETITGTDTARAVTPDGLAARSVVATIAQSSLTDDNIVTITHNLGTADVIVQLFDMSTEATVFADVYRTAADLSTASTSVISIDFGTAPANDIRCLITSLAGATASGTIAYT